MKHYFDKAFAAVDTVVAEDTKKGFKLAGFKFELQDAITKEVIETLITGEDGSAISSPIDYRQAYRIVQVEAMSPYSDSDNEIIIEMKSSKNNGLFILVFIF